MSVLRLHILLLVLVLAPPARAQNTEAVRLYDEGTQQLLDGNYSGAVESYRAVLDLGMASTALYYNLGVAYYRLDQLGEAIRSFERARRLDPDDRRIEHNLEIARANIPERFSRLPVRFWTRGWQRIVALLGVGGLFTLGFLFWIVAFAVVAWTVRAGRRPPWSVRLGWSAGICATVLVAASIAASVRSPFGDQAVIVDDTTPLYSSAAGDQAGISLHEGLTVFVEEREGSWIRVRLPNGVSGWVEARAAADV